MKPNNPGADSVRDGVTVEVEKRQFTVVSMKLLPTDPRKFQIARSRLPITRSAYCASAVPRNFRNKYGGSWIQHPSLKVGMAPSPCQDNRWPPDRLLIRNILHSLNFIPIHSYASLPNPSSFIYHHPSSFTLILLNSPSVLPQSNSFTLTLSHSWSFFFIRPRSSSFTFIQPQSPSGWGWMRPELVEGDWLWKPADFKRLKQWYKDHHGWSLLIAMENTPLPG